MAHNRYTYNAVSQTYAMTGDLPQDMKTIIDGFLYNKQFKNFENGQDPALRAAFIKTHGGARAKFTITHSDINKKPEIASILKRGIFTDEASFDAWVRFSSDVNVEKSDKNSTVGCSIKLFNVPGMNILDYGSSKDKDNQTTTVDFALQNYPVFFARDAKQMADYLSAKYAGTLKEFRSVSANKNLSSIIDHMIASDPSSVLKETYWSCVPFIIDDEANNQNDFLHYCKYILAPTPGQNLNNNIEKSNPRFLRDDFAKNLKSSSYKFDLYIHLKTQDGQDISNASDNWDNGTDDPVVDPFGTNDVTNIYKIATLEIAQQDITQRGQDNYIETLSFNPWRTLPENRPVGEIALARRVAYELAAKARRDLNGQTVGEPLSARPAAFNSAPYQTTPKNVAWSEVSQNPSPTPSPTPSQENDIVRIAIHPGIGIARVGNSLLDSSDWVVGDDDYADMYIGPETDAPKPTEYEKVRDNKGKIKRQGARFRLYGYNSKGEVVKEILPDDKGTSITWKTTLANRKPQWFRFDHAWDKDYFRNEEKQPSILRNDTVEDRASLAITPDTMSITGKQARSHPISANFLGADVTLGELRTDQKGRLIVLGGMGKADTIAQSEDPDHFVFSKIVQDKNVGNSGSFNNSNQWYDDVSDGPVHAEVTIEGKTYDVDPAWVVVAPPNFAPDIVGVTTLYERLEELYITAGMLPAPKQVSFKKHVLPTLQRLSQLGWVNKGFHDLFGPNKNYDFFDEDTIFPLKVVPKSGKDTYRSNRQDIFEKFQDPSSPESDPHKWPMLYGDSFGEDVVDPNDPTKPFLNVKNPDEVTALSYIRYSWLKRWADGDFINDSDDLPVTYATIDDVPVKEQPALLDKAALHFCLADAFHPGCEVTWPMRHLSIYRAPFRIREADTSDAYVPVKGETFDHTDANTPDKGLAAQPAGGLTRWMALPWHGDTARCRGGYDAEHEGGYGDYTPTYWPARVPNQVLTQDNYEKLKDNDLQAATKLKAFDTRQNWWRNMSTNPDSRASDDEEMQAQFMIKNYDKMGTVLQVDNPYASDDLPKKIYVEHIDTKL